MIVLVKFILMHLTGDFILQPKSWVEEKEKQGAKSLKLYLHGLIHGALVWLVLWDLRHWAVALSITIVHVGIDMVKLFFQKKNNKTGWFLMDQLLHVLSIVVLWYLFFNPDISFGALAENLQFWIYVTAILFLTVVCGIGIQVLLTNWTKDIYLDKEKSLPNAGRYIGILERLLVFLFVVLGRWEAIGFLIAAKSVFRFGDLKDSRNRKLTEYILIGTLLSFGIAIVTGILTLYLSTV
ncbi:DUF3307 domain-containing protein [Petrimonas sp.]|uniref:DUF3307 domain-containing protein n=1 Tax=Petrimonas sp. TaxID=2023866 RepID=UPI003322F4F9